MNKKQKQITKTVQILLWIWFGVITSIISVNTLNIRRLEAQNEVQNKLLYEKIKTVQDDLFLLQYKDHYNIKLN